ncbi:hypothetical protein SCARR_00360 [Pontiella sulfatireligans]|uniref:Uncharacterized protein n=1 Tax=Pontiella sulfatireligans TaxID=2750658 RepID=A0A6C2UDN3_9BACT|nr:hypothetical protein SCARR_00360 [Pontiella sulfatireligans]
MTADPAKKQDIRHLNQTPISTNKETVNDIFLSEIIRYSKIRFFRSLPDQGQPHSHFAFPAVVPRIIGNKPRID